MSTLPSGTVTFLFTDIEGSTKLWEQHPEAMKSALTKHDSILKTAIESQHGHIIKTTGDGVHAVFTTALDAVNAAINAQRGIEKMKDESGKMNKDADNAASSFISHPSFLHLKVRMGIHTGEAELRESDYYGTTLNRAARIMSAGHGGQILISEVTAQLIRDQLSENISLGDLGEHALKGLSRVEHIFQVNAPGLQNEFPALHTDSAVNTNLPTQLTSFIGRENEIQAASQKLSGARLLTLIGPGGTGKTRLSLQLASEVISQYSDGVWLVELASIADAHLVPQALGAIFSLREQPGMPLNNMLIDFLRSKNMLLIFDNCEHLVETCAQLAEQILHNAPQVKILASSREALGIGGEAIFRVPSLSSPDPADVTREAVAGFESAQLFVDRARAANPIFELSDVNASSLAQICRRLDGIPLALELAAARISVFTVEQIATRLDDRFKLLTGGRRTALPRQQTLRALIDWSYDILSEGEKILLRRLSVFAGGWTFEAAEAIGGELDMLDLLSQLVNKSLVTVDESGSAARYRLLETIRQYARDRLLDAGETEKTRRAHLDYFLRFAEEAGPKMDTDELMKWIPKLEAEYDNFRAAFEWALDNDLDAALVFINYLSAFIFRRSHNAEGIQWANESIARAEKQGAPADTDAAQRREQNYANALGNLVIMAYSQGDNPLAVQTSAKCVPLLRKLGNERMLALVLGFTVSARMFSGDFSPENLGTMDEVIALSRRSGNNFSLGMALGLMAQVTALASHDLVKAAEYDNESIRLVNESENNWGSLMAYFSSGRGAMFRRDFVTARERFEKCLPMFNEMGDVHRATMIHSEFAHMDRYEGKLDSAEAGYRKTIPVWQRIGHRAAIAHQLECFAFIAKAREQSERAATLFGAAEALREKIKITMTPPEQVAYDQEVADLKKNSNETEFTQAWNRGHGMSLDEAVKFALSRA